MGNPESEIGDVDEAQRVEGNFPDFLRGHGISYDIINNFVYVWLPRKQSVIYLLSIN